MKSVGRSLAVAAAAAASEGSGRGSARAASSSRRRACCTAAWRKWLFWSFWPMLCAAWVFGFPVKDAFTSFSREARSVADVAEAAGEMVEAGANATVQAAHAALEAVSTTTYVAEEIWRGVDLRHVEMHRSAVKVRGLDCGAIATRIEDGGGGSVPSSLSSHLSKMIATVTESVPELQHHGDRFSVLGWFHTYQIRVRRRLDGSCVAAVLITNSSFDLEWMMPAWDALGFDPDSQSKQVIKQLYSALHELEPAPTGFWTLDDHSAAVATWLQWGLRVALVGGVALASAASRSGIWQSHFRAALRRRCCVALASCRCLGRRVQEAPSADGFASEPAPVFHVSEEYVMS